MAAVQIQRTFDVTTDGPRFASFIDRLRNDLRDQTRPPLFDGLNMLRPYTDVPQQWLRLTVRASGWAVVLMLRTDNLYTIGFVAESQQWAPGSKWEFKPDPGVDQKRHLIDQSRFLGFDGSYNSSHGMGELVAGTEIVGWKPLQDAIAGLAAYQGDNAQGPAVRVWLRTIVVTFSESIRSRVVSALIDGLLRDKKNDRLTARQVGLIKDWSTICEALYLSAVDPAHHPEDQAYRQLKRSLAISNNYQARLVLGIVYVGPNPRY